MSDEAIGHEAVAFTTYYQKLYASHARPFIESVFDEWAETKDFAPGDRAEIKADVLSLLGAEQKVS